MCSVSPVRATEFAEKTKLFRIFFKEEGINSNYRGNNGRMARQL
jgi:hypothetical protein